MSHSIGTANVKKVSSKNVFRKGRGFSQSEIKAAINFFDKKLKSSEIGLKDFMKEYRAISSVKIDLRRRSTHENNVEFLKNFSQTVKSEEKKVTKTKKKPVKKTIAVKKTAKKKSTAKKTTKKTTTAKKTTKKKSTAKKTTKKKSTAKKTSKKSTKKKTTKKTTTKA